VPIFIHFFLFFMMRFLIIFLTLFFFAACKNETPKAPAADLRISEQAEELKKCVRDSNCVEVSFTLPQLEGGPNATATKIINDSLKAAILGSNRASYTLRQAIDSTMQQMLADLKQQLTDMDDPQSTMGYYEQAEGKIIWSSPKVVSAAFSYSYYTGGAHGMYGTDLVTYDLHSGKEYKITDLIKDTTALRPLLEAKILTQKRSEDNTIATLKDMLFEPDSPLQLPVNVCVVKEGLRFVYNPYEIMAYAYGQSDVTLTWEELGKIADRNTTQ
jgi:hypothetical protein